MKKSRMFKITIGNDIHRVVAKSPSQAARTLFRDLIGRGVLKRQPPVDFNTGGWVGVKIE